MSRLRFPSSIPWLVGLLAIGLGLCLPADAFAARRMNSSSVIRMYQQALQSQQKQMQQAQELTQQQQQARAAAEQHRKDVMHQANEANRAAAKERGQRARDRAAAQLRDNNATAGTKNPAKTLAGSK